MLIDRVVIDASPLITLFRFGLHSLLPQLFPELLVPDSVWNEIGSLHLVFKVDLLNWDRLANKRLKDNTTLLSCSMHLI